MKFQSRKSVGTLEGAIISTFKRRTVRRPNALAHVLVRDIGDGLRTDTIPLPFP